MKTLSLLLSSRARIIRRRGFSVLFALGAALALLLILSADARAQSAGFNTNAALLEEVQEESPSLALIRYLLSDANPPANPNAPILIMCRLSRLRRNLDMRKLSAF